MKRLYADIHRRIGGFDLNVLIDSDADRIGILGESGSGKSMTLKSIAGIEPVDSGHIEVNGRVLYDSLDKTDLKPQKRNVGYMFQNYALFPTMSVLKNVMAGLGKPKEGAPDTSGMEYVIMLAVGKTKEEKREAHEFKRNALSEISDRMDDRLEPARLAPSSVNSQPWYFEHTDLGIRAYKKRLVRTAGLSRMNTIDVGIALAHLYVANPDTFTHFVENPAPVRDKMDYILTFNI
jgi:hypothetical protein